MEPNSFSVIKAQTFTPLYSPAEDRIRLIVNYADYPNRVDLWLTRAFLLKLIPTLEDCLDQHDISPLTPEAQKQTEEKAKSATDAPTMAMTEKDGVLVQSVDITYHSETQQFLLVFKTSGDHVSSMLSPPLLRALLKSIFSAIPKIEWGISPHWF